MGIVGGTEKEPAAMDPDVVSDWETCELDACVQIQLTLEEEVLSGVMSTITAKDPRIVF
jgi:hypothetical protein